jgi:ribonucleotide monophosphatase NagD (HAD superfamily)
VVGKPAAAFFEFAVAGLEVPAADALMVGDDVDNDVIAAQRCGLTGVLVRTGKYNARALAAATAEPDHVIDSVADLPALLARG